MIMKLTDVCSLSLSVCVCVCVCTCRYNLFLEMMAQVRRNCIYSVYQFKPEQVVQPAKEEEDVKAEV